MDTLFDSLKQNTSIRKLGLYIYDIRELSNLNNINKFLGKNLIKLKLELGPMTSKFKNRNLNDMIKLVENNSTLDTLILNSNYINIENFRKSLQKNHTLRKLKINEYTINRSYNFRCWTIK